MQKNALIGLVAVGVVIVVGFALLFLYPKKSQDVKTVENLSASLTDITTAAVPATADPLKEATPAVNPVETANPFNTNAYKNPFE